MGRNVEEEQGPEEGAEEQAQEVVVDSDSGGWLSNAPWWLVSAGLHVVILLSATLVYVERLMAIDEGEMVVAVTPPSAAVVNEIERPRDVFERKGIPKDDGNTAPPTEEPAIFFPEAKESDHNESA